MNKTALLQNKIHFHFVDGAFVEITGDVDEEYSVQFIDTRTDEIVHQAQIKNNHWVRTSRQYFTPWQINVFRLRDKELLFTHQYECKGKRVYIAFESKALGDTLAWFQLVDDFQKKHECELSCSTFMNNLFKDEYPHIQFVEPSETVHNLYAMYRVGWFYLPNGEIDFNKNVKNFRCQTLGESAADILGLPYLPVRPKLNVVDLGKPILDDYVCIAVHSTAQAKYWNNPNGWTDLVNYLREQGYQVVLLSKEGMSYMGNQAPDGVIQIPPGEIGIIMNYLLHAKLFVGIGSGLSWLSWALNRPTCVISGFSEPYTEVSDMIRIGANPNDCSACFNRYPMNAGDWNWCPDHKDTLRMFECTRNISAQQVIDKITAYLPQSKNTL